jgi:hypothetical protein
MKKPYTTRSGVRIGSMYTPPARGLEFSKDELRIQRALLGERTPIDWNGIAIVIITAAVVAALIFWSYK